MGVDIRSVRRGAGHHGEDQTLAPAISGAHRVVNGAGGGDDACRAHRRDDRCASRHVLNEPPASDRGGLETVAADR